MKSVIINADDFGLSPGVNRGIVESFREGVVTSTTLLANLPAFDDAVALARANGLPVGVHLSLLGGRPVTDAARVPSLVDRDGVFVRSAGRLAARYLAGRLAADEIRTEFDSQVRRVRDAGLEPTHLDTHKHIHGLRGIRRVLLDTARAFEIVRVRLPCEQGKRGGPRHARSRLSGAKRGVLRMLCAGAAAELRAAGLRTTDHFAGVTQSACLDGDALAFILDHLEEGVTEIMCHPGYPDEEMRRYSSVPPHREVELAALTDARIKDRIRAGSLRLVHYGDL